jgi:hypothetical protein
MVEIPPKLAEFRPKQQKFDLFLVEFRPIFEVEILLCGFAHFWANFGQNGRNEITVHSELNSLFCNFFKIYLNGGVKIMRQQNELNLLYF